MFFDVTDFNWDDAPTVEEPAVKPAAEPARKNRGGRPKGSGAKPTGALKLARRTLAVAALDDSARTSLATLLGLKEADDVAVLAVASVEQGQTARRPADDLASLAAAGPRESVLQAIELSEDQARFRAAWQLLGAHVPSLPSRVPSDSTKAGFQLACAVDELDEDAWAAMKSILSYLG